MEGFLPSRAPIRLPNCSFVIRRCFPLSHPSTVSPLLFERAAEIRECDRKGVFTCIYIYLVLLLGYPSGVVNLVIVVPTIKQYTRLFLRIMTVDAYREINYMHDMTV